MNFCEMSSNPQVWAYMITDENVGTNKREDFTLFLWEKDNTSALEIPLCFMLWKWSMQDVFKLSFSLIILFIKILDT